MLVKLARSKGFSLIELAIVLFVVSLLLGGILGPLSVQIESENRSSTSDILDDIEDSLMGFAVINGRLPCPDCPDGNVGTCTSVAAANRNDGIGDWSGTVGSRVCRTSVGNVPWVDLSTTEFDAWSRHFTYRVTLEFSRESQDGTPASCGTPAIGVSFEMCSDGDIDIYDSYIIGTTGYPSTASLVTENVPAIVISHGKDGYDPTQTDQQVENFDRDPVNPVTGIDILTTYVTASYTDSAFVYTDYSLASGDINFDDLVRWISPTILINKMIESGKLP